MLRKPVPPKNCGGEGTQKSGLQAPAGSGSAWGAQVTPPSWLASTAPARDKQALVSQPSAGVANAIPVLSQALGSVPRPVPAWFSRGLRSEEHTSELQSRENLVCRLLLETKK